MSEQKFLILDRKIVIINYIIDYILIYGRFDISYSGNNLLIYGVYKIA